MADSVTGPDSDHVRDVVARLLSDEDRVTAAPCSQRIDQVAAIVKKVGPAGVRDAGEFATFTDLATQTPDLTAPPGPPGTVGGDGASQAPTTNVPSTSPLYL